MDLEVVHAMAPSAQLVVYEAGTPNPGYILGDVAIVLQSAIGTYPHAVYNLSLGWCEDAASAQQFDGLFTKFGWRWRHCVRLIGRQRCRRARCCVGHNLTTQEPADSPHACRGGGPRPISVSARRTAKRQCGASRSSNGEREAA